LESKSQKKNLPVDIFDFQFQKIASLLTEFEEATSFRLKSGVAEEMSAEVGANRQRR
jgi:hypothetical protein